MLGGGDGWTLIQVLPSGGGKAKLHVKTGEMPRKEFNKSTGCHAHI